MRGPFARHHHPPPKGDGWLFEIKFDGYRDTTRLLLAARWTEFASNARRRKERDDVGIARRRFQDREGRLDEGRFTLHGA